MMTPLTKKIKHANQLKWKNLLVLIIVISVISFNYSVLAQTSPFTASASGTFTVPAGITSIKVECWGGGGGGGSRTSTGLAGGGGGGAYATNTLTVTPGTVYNFTIGTGGPAGTSGNSTTFNTNSVIAVGGSAGSNSSGGVGGAANSCAPTVNAKSGGNGAAPSVSISGGGGGAGGAASAGGNGSASTTTGGGTGNSGITGFAGTGANGVSNSTNTAGLNGGNYGGGGSGATRSSGSTTINGGAGAGGYITITWTCAAPSITASSLAAQTVCLNSTFSAITVTSPTTGVTYQWYSNTSASTSGATSLGAANGAQTNSYTPQASVAGTTYYYCIVKAACGTTTTSSFSGAFVVTAPATNTMSYTTNNYCAGATGTVSVATQTAAGGGTYSSSPSGLIIHSSTGVITLTGSTANNYIVKYTLTGGVCPVSDSVNFNIRPLPTVTCPGNSSKCINSAPYLLTGASPSGSTGVYSAAAGISGSNGIYYFDPRTAGSGFENITYTYTDFYGCSNSCNYTINVTGTDFLPSATPVASFVYSGDSVKILLSSTVAGTQFSWTASTNNPSITGFSSQTTPTTSTVIAQQVYNISPTSGQITYTITPSLNGCTGTPISIFISMPSSTFCESPGTFQKGSCIIDMGASPQTYANGIKPYGLLYQLLNVYKVPVYWAIKPDKTYGTNPLNKTDAVDFTVDGFNYKGGAFIIPAAYMSQVQSEISSWVSQGVVARNSLSNFNPPVYELLTRFPKVVLDSRNGATIKTDFYDRAGIPAIVNGESTYTSGGVPTNIGTCDDVYVLPHADPQLWSQTYKDSLLTFINNRGWLYASCKAVSGIESSPNMCFLSSTGLISDSFHIDGTPPYSYNLGAGVESATIASDPFSQSVGTLDAVASIGAETVFLPKSTWRPTTKIAIYDANFLNQGTHSAFGTNFTYTANNPTPYVDNAAILAYGRAFGNPQKGMILYLAGHDFSVNNNNNTPTAAQMASEVAAARIYGNFILRDGITSRPIISNISIPGTANSGATISMSVTIPLNTTIEWTSDLNGIFSAPNSTSTTFSPPSVDVQTQCTIQVKIKDGCGRTGLYCTTITINPTITNNYITGTQSVCSGTIPQTALTGTIALAPNNAAVSYQWLISTTGASTGFIAINGANAQNYTPSALTQTSWFRRQVSANGISVVSTTIQVTVNPGPAITTQPSTAGQTVCQTGTFSPITVASSESNVNYQWFYNATASTTGSTNLGVNNGAQTNSYTPTTSYSTAYYYCVITSISSGCATTSNFSGTFNTIPNISLTNPSTVNSTLCEGAPISALSCAPTLGNGSGLNYQWCYYYLPTITPGSSANASASLATRITGANSPTYTPNVVGSYYYFCQVTLPAGTGCSGSQLRNSNFSGLITINPLPVASLTSNSNTTVLNCNTTSISLSASGSLANGTVSYLWNNGLGTNSNIVVTNPGNDTVTIIGSNGCSIKSGVAITKDITLPTAGITNNYATNMLTCDTKSISVTATGGATDSSYLWSNGLGIYSNVFLNAAGTYTVRVKGANGCTKDTSIVIVSAIVGSTWTGAGNNLYWENPDNWCGPVPTDTSDVIITNTGGFDPVISNTMAKARNITIQPGANIYMDGQTLQLYGNLNASNNLDATYGNIELKGTIAQIISGSNFAGNRIKNLRISNSTGVTLSGTNDTLKLTGTLDFGKSNCTLNANGNLTVVSDAGNTGRIGDMTLNGLSGLNNLSGNKITGNVTVERYIPNHTKAWQMLAIPTVGQTIKDAWQEGNSPLSNTKPGYGTIITSNNGGSTPGANNLGFDIYTSTGGTLKYFNPTDSSWVGVASTNTTPIANSKGYLILIRGDRSVTAYNQAPTATKLRTTGLLYQPVGNAPATINVIADKYESVGNPYASAIDLTKLTRTGGTQDVYYIWDPKLTSASTSAYGLGGYQTFIRNGSTYTVTPGGGSYANGNVNIESGQAFLVRSFGTSGTVSFAENQKTVGGSIVTRETNTISNLMARLSVVYNGTSILLDGALTQFDDEFSNEINEEDALKLMGGSIENISVLHNGIKLVGDKRKSIVNTDTIFYSLNNLRTQNYKLNFTPDLLTGIVSAKLIDNFLGTSTPLSLDTATEISFASTVNTPSAASNRFYIVLESMGALPVNIKSISAVQNNDKTNTVYWNVENETNIEKYVVEKSLNGINFNVLESTLPKTNNGGAANYNLIDLHPAEGSNFYRVKAISVGGFVQYSKIVKLSSAIPTSSILLYPNPVVDHKANLHFNNIEAGSYSVIVYNAKGQRLQMSTILTTFKTEEIALKLNGSFTAGDYEMQIISSNGKNYHQKFIIK